MAIRLGGAGNRVNMGAAASNQVNLVNPKGKVDLTKNNGAAINLSGASGKVDLTNSPSGKVDLTHGSSSTLPIYDGEYTVIPKAEEEQTLETSGYAMANDVVVKEIPYFEVKNVAGGVTATIG